MSRYHRALPARCSGLRPAKVLVGVLRNTLARARPPAVEEQPTCARNLDAVTRGSPRRPTQAAARASKAPRTWKAVLALACLLHLPQLAAAEASERDVSLEELLAYAATHAPALQLAARRRGYAEAARADAAPWLRDNPSLELGAGPRFDRAEGRDYDLFASLSQPVEIAGERGLRLTAAARAGERLDAETAAVRWELRRALGVLYRTAVVARERVSIAQHLEGFAQQMLEIARRRLAAGDASAIDVRVAETDLAQLQQARVSAQQELRMARIGLAEVSGWPIESPPGVAAALTPPAPVPALGSLLEAARVAHPELRVRRAALTEARARVKLADREAWPAPSIGVQFAREGSAGSPANYILLGRLGIALPFWQQNQGERARSRVDAEVAQADAQLHARAIRARIARAHAELSGAAERLALYTTSVAPQLEDSLSLLRRGFEAGELPLLEVAVARERFWAAQRDALSAYTDYYRALVELEYALGTPLPAAAQSGGAP